MPNKVCWKFEKPNIIKPVLHIKVSKNEDKDKDDGIEIDEKTLAKLKAVSNIEPQKYEGVIKVSQEILRQLDTVARFYFELTRYKDSATHVESLKIDSFYDGKENGSITTTIYSLEDDIRELMKYGVAFSTIVFRDMRKTIEENYLLLNTVTVTVKSDDRFNSLINLVNENMKKQENASEDFYSIPVKDFDELAKDCEYKDYEMRVLREKLAKSGLIKAGNERYTTTDRIKDKVVRVIKFDIDEVKKTASSEISSNEEKSDT